MRRARGAGLSTHFHTPPRQSPLRVVSRRLSHCRPHPPLLPTRPCAPAGRGGARRPANERAPGARPRRRGTPHSPRGACAPPGARRLALGLARATPARHGVRAHLFRVSSDKLRVKRARTPYTARYVKGPRRPTLPGGRLLSHAEGTVDFFSFDQFAWSWLSVGGRRTLTRHRSSSCSRQPQRG